MFKDRFEPQNIHGFKIEHIKPSCVACRHELRLTPGTPGPNDEIFMVGGNVFYIDKALLGLAKSVTIDAAGDIPVLFASGSLDPRENN